MINLEANHWDNLYDLLCHQLENPKINRFNRHLINYGIINVLHRLHLKTETSDVIKLTKIVTGTIEDKKVDLGKIIIGERQYGVITNSYGLEKCVKCNMENYCDGSYVATGAFVEPERMFVAFRLPKEEIEPGNCNCIAYSIHYNNWGLKGKEQLMQIFKNKINPKRLEFAVKLLVNLYEIQEHIYYLKDLQKIKLNLFPQ